ncbi:MAG: ABC transporter ATP-binding protein, partial [Candidatus Tectomicrobia bacterium]|nr:ABC transporter ATP-binding protein [Candidatus Tectomicrobia bacterium]
MRRYGRILRYARGEWRTFLLVSGLTLAASGVAALQPWPLKVLVDFALGGAPLPDSPRLLLEEVRPIATPVVLIIAAALGSVALFALRSAVDTGLNWAWAAAGQRMVHALAADLFHRLQRLSPIFHSRRTVGDTLNRLTTDTWCVYTVCEGLLVTPAQQIVLLTTLSVVAFRLDPGLALPLLGIAPALGASACFFGRRLKRNAGMNRAAHSRLTSFVHQTLTAIPIVQAFGTEERNGYEYRRLAADAVSLSRRGTFLKDAYTLANGLITTVGVASILYLAGRRVLAGSLSVGSLLVFLGYLQSMQGAWQSLLGTYGSLKSAGASVDRVLEVLDSGGGVVETRGARGIEGRSRGHVRVEGVTF